MKAKDSYREPWGALCSSLEEPQSRHGGHRAQYHRPQGDPGLGGQ